MKRVQVVILSLAVGGCSSIRFSQQEPTQPISAAPQVSQRDIPPTLSPAARSAAPKTDADLPQGNTLRECVTESCRINCSPKVPKRSRPKWCVNFKEPI